MNDINSMYPEDRNELYHLLQEQLKAILDNEPNVIPNLCNASALLNLALQDINWVGFYLMHNNELLLGPFQGKPACIHIAVGKGVCGTAVSQEATQLVPDVHAFPGHIACDSASRSEIVVPIRANGRIVGVLDIDSPSVGRFDRLDQDGLERFVQILEVGCEWNQILL
jgi:L-methionine (R)-S-oxide reductase